MVGYAREMIEATTLQFQLFASNLEATVWTIIETKSLWIMIMISCSYKFNWLISFACQNYKILKPYYLQV